MLLVVASLFLIYPMVANWYVLTHNTTVVADYLEEDVEAKLEHIRQQEERNAKIDETNFYAADPFNETEIIEDTGDEVDIVGVLNIPQIGESLAIYEETNTSTLSKGLGLLEGTHYPTGGIGNTSVVTGHRGTSSAEMLRHIDKIELGDVVWVDNGVERLYYQVYDEKLVLPHETEVLQRVPGKDVLILLTCETPDITKGFNTHRLLIYTERVPAPDRPDEIVTVASPTLKFNLLGIGGSALLIIGLVLMLRKGRGRREKK